MRKSLLFLIILTVFIVMPSTVLGRTPKPPKVLCFSFDNGLSHLNLSFKKSQKVKNADGVTRFYTVQGTQNVESGVHSPAFGLAFVRPDQQELVTTLSASTFYGVSTLSFIWNLELMFGTLSVNGSGGGNSYTLSLVDCRTIDPIP